MEEFSHSTLLPETVVRATRELRAVGVVAEERRQPAAEISLRGASEHLVVLQLGSSFGSAASVDGRPTEQQTMRAGDLSIIPAGMPLEISWDRPNHVLHLELSGALLERAVEDAGVRAVALVPRLKVRDPAVEGIARSFLEEVRTGGFATRLYAEALTQALTIQLMRRHSNLEAQPVPSSPRGLSREALSRVQDFISDNLGETISVDSIAAEAHLSPFHFARLFKEATGLAPHQFVIQARVRRATELWSARPSLSIAQVAAEIGFFDQSHLTRHFKRVIGVTPAEFRRSRSR